MQREAGGAKLCAAPAKSCDARHPVAGSLLHAPTCKHLPKLLVSSRMHAMANSSRQATHRAASSLRVLLALLTAAMLGVLWVKDPHVARSVFRELANRPWSIRGTQGFSATSDAGCERMHHARVSLVLRSCATCSLLTGSTPCAGLCHLPSFAPFFYSSRFHAWDKSAAPAVFCSTRCPPRDRAKSTCPRQAGGHGWRRSRSA